jgi:REP element-mobilizing transposase RayT
MSQDCGNELLPDPIAFFFTWSNYGTWLPGDERGWVEYRRGWQLADPIRLLEAQMLQTEDACILSLDERAVVNRAIADHCKFRGWQLHAVNCRSNHCHVVTGAHAKPDKMRVQFKAWGTRRLKEHAQEHKHRSPEALRRSSRRQWWAERGSNRWIYRLNELSNVVDYVLDGQ